MSQLLISCLKDNLTAAVVESGLLKVYSNSSDCIQGLTDNTDLLFLCTQGIFPDVVKIEFIRYDGSQSEMKLLIATEDEINQLEQIKIQDKLEQEEAERREKIEDTNRCVAMSRIPANLCQEYTFENFKVVDIDKGHTNREAYRLARQFAGTNDPEDEEYGQTGWHNFLTYYGNTGTGKTRLAMTIGLFLAEQRRSVRYWQVEKLMDAIRATFNKSKGRYNLREEAYRDALGDEEDTYETIMESLEDCEILILDDLSVENGTDWVRAKLDRIIDYRYEHEMKTIITSNVNDINELTARIASRLSEGNICNIQMPDFRKVKAIQREKKLRKANKLNN
jgi:DNA replication protein DnaC